MLTRRIIPCLDVRAGRVVKGVRFQHLRDAGDPSELAARYQEEGADEVVLLDVSATEESRAAAAATVAAVRRTISIPLTVGGGVRSIDDAARLLDAGADKVGMNTAAKLRPQLIAETASRFGAQCVVVAIDAAQVADRPGTWDVLVRSGTASAEQDAVQWARQAEDMGAGELLLTSWDRDGTQSGYDLDLTREVARAVNIPVVASGGAAGPTDFINALQAGADAVLAASIFHSGMLTVGELKAVLAAKGIEVRR